MINNQNKIFLSSDLSVTPRDKNLLLNRVSNNAAKKLCDAIDSMIKDMPAIPVGADSSRAFPAPITIDSNNPIDETPLERIIRYAKALVNNDDLKEAMQANLEIGWAYTDFVELKEAIAEYEASNE